MSTSNFAYCIADEANREKMIDALNKRYSFLKVGTLSKSLCGRNIHYFEIGEPSEQVLFVGAFHGMEWLTSSLLIRFVYRLCESIKCNENISDVHMRDFLKSTGLLVIPCLNPDGVEISLYGENEAGRYSSLVREVSNGNTSRWQTNARGVDLNHNFDADWEQLRRMEINSGIVGAAPTRYGGRAPESEPESHALAELCRTRNIKHAVAFHSQGEEIYWNYGEHTPKRSKLMADVMAASSGYTVSNPEGLAVGGGFKDWFIDKLHRPGFTIEIGKGENPLPLQDLPAIYYRLEEMLVLTSLM